MRALFRICSAIEAVNGLVMLLLFVGAFFGGFYLEFISMLLLLPLMGLRFFNAFLLWRMNSLGYCLAILVCLLSVVGIQSEGFSLYLNTGIHVNLQFGVVFVDLVSLTELFLCAGIALLSRRASIVCLEEVSVDAE